MHPSRIIYIIPQPSFPCKAIDPPDSKCRSYPQSRHETGLAIRQTESRGPPGPLLIDFIVLLRDFAGGAVLEFRRTFFFTILYALCNVIRQVAVPVLSIAAAAAARSCGVGCPGCGKRRFSPNSDSKGHAVGISSGPKGRFSMISLNTQASRFGFRSDSTYHDSLQGSQ